MLKRHIQHDIHTYLQHFPSLLITGARQVGKSTLALSLGIEHYVTLDDIATYQSAKTDPKGFINSLATPVIIDEVQRAPEIFIAIKEAIDQDRSPGRFILTGSSNLQGFRNLSDSLAGRIGIVDLYALSLSEIYQSDLSLIDKLFSDDELEQPSVVNITDNILLGGFPEIQTLPNAKTRLLWFSSYIRTYIERDLHDVSTIRNLDKFMRLYLALALRSGNLLNKADISRDCQIDTKSLDNYLSILNNTYQVRLLKPYFNNELKRLVKMPKVYMLDSGILCHLLKITQTAELVRSSNKGLVYETFVMSEITKAISYAEKPVDLGFYRTNDGKEIDFILDDGHSLVIIEVKAAHTVISSDFKHLKYFIDAHKKPVHRAIILYAGERVLPFGEHDGVALQAVPLGCLGG
uniref:ATPase n=1 Tax=uncultured Thiotrichaceae bacterium TaxID=298394 RepID=A0A6S6U6G1_9GAMM|nr:MAG: ATPase [uncultured Thiotrichaceae bacterium]